MAGMVVNVFGVLSKLNDEAFSRLKSKIQENKTHFINPKDHPVAGPLLNILCDNRIIAVMDRELLAQVIQAMIPKDILVDCNI